MWERMWPDEATVIECNLPTLIMWNLHLPEPDTEKTIVWDLLRQRLLFQTGVTTKLQSVEDIIETYNLLELHNTQEFPLNLMYPYEGKLDDQGICSIVSYYQLINENTRGFLAHIVQLIVSNASRDHAKAVFFPHIGNIQHPLIEGLL